MLGACVWGMKQTYQEERTRRLPLEEPPRMAGERRELQRVAGTESRPKEVDAGVWGSRQSKNPWR